MEQAALPDQASDGQAFADMRAAQRYTLLIRTAKLVSESGEFLCVVRDVSETGLRLKLFHDLPPEQHMAIELSNGDFYLIERVWMKDDHAGFRFSAPIDVFTFIEEPGPWPRRPVRLKLEREGVITAEGTKSAAQLLDISQQGARVSCENALPVGQKVRLDIPGLPPISATICWRSAPDHGLAFQTFFALDTLAQQTAALQLAQVPPTPSDDVRYG